MKFNVLGSMGRLALMAATIQFAFVQPGRASGYEKGIMWGGRSAGVAGIASPYIAGSQAIYFNPAGLANDKAGQDASFNLTLLTAKLKGPINPNVPGSTESSKDKILTPLGLTYDYTLNDKLGFGIGYFVSGGASAKYENVAYGFGTANGTANLNTDLMISELSLGAGYKVTEDFKIGLAYRISMAKAEFAVATPAGTNTYANIAITDLKTTDWTGFRLGAQYRLFEHTKLGFNYRSEVNLSADGTSSTYLNGSATPASQNSATVKTTFPQQAQLGVLQEYTEWRALAEYVWSQYSRVGDIYIRNNSTGGNSNVTMNWKDEHQVRLGGEYLAWSWPLRFGYAWTSQVTNSDYSRATFAPPASAHTLTLGTGQIFQVASNPLQFDVAGEYSFSSGDGNEGLTSGRTDIRGGTYTANVFGLHLGVSYAF